MWELCQRYVGCNSRTLFDTIYMIQLKVHSLIILLYLPEMITLLTEFRDSNVSFL